MLLDLFSTVTGGVIVLVVECIAIVLFGWWAVASVKKEVSEKITCPFVFDEFCPKTCKHWKKCRRQRFKHV
jgi:hypothetical protein